VQKETKGRGVVSNWPAASHTWEWQAFASWKEEIWTLLAKIVDDGVREAFIKQPPEYVVGDDLSWLDSIIMRVHKCKTDSKTFLTEKIHEKYHSIRAFHGARPNNIDLYYKHGILPLDYGVADAMAREIFVTPEFPEVTPLQLEKAIQHVREGKRDGLVFFEANEDLLIERCGHYMLYGSEYLTAVAAWIEGTRDYRKILKRYGEPTIFVCDVPFDLMGFDTVKQFAGVAIELVFEELLNPEQYCPDRLRDAGFRIKQALPGSCIVGHYHPTIEFDPLARRY